MESQKAERSGSLPHGEAATSSQGQDEAFRTEEPSQGGTGRRGTEREAEGQVTALTSRAGSAGAWRMRTAG